MKTILFVISVLAVTAYLAVAAREDYKTCEVTRWKHLIGFIPAIYLYGRNITDYSMTESGAIFMFLAIVLMIGCLGIYGMADGFVLANLTLFFGSVGRVAGIGMVILIMILAAVSFLINHLVLCVFHGTNIFQNRTAAFVPHIFTGYVCALTGWLLCTAI